MAIGSFGAALSLALADYLVVAIPVTLVGLWLVGQRKTSFFVFVTVVASIAVSYAMGLVHSHPAPYMVSSTIASGSPENSFPSQHTTVLFAMVWPLAYRHRRRLAGAFLVGAMLTGVARVIVGYHYPIDVLGGIVASVVGAALAVIAREYILLAGRQAIALDDRLRGMFLD